MKKIFRLFAFIAIVFLSSPLSAKEPTNILLGFGIGVGQSKLSVEHSHAMLYPIYGAVNPGNPQAGIRPLWAAHTNQYFDSLALAWEFLAGYKHFINDYVGFRYYGNVGFQHYQAKSLGDKKQNIGYIDYTLNMDLLIDFYESELFAVGMVGGLGFGGTSFYSKAITRYMAVYNASTGIPVGVADVQKHFLNANASVGLRMAFFQKYRRTSARVCDQYKDGKRSCKVPIYYLGHNIEVNAKFPLLSYRATPLPDMIIDPNDNNNRTSRPAYTVKNTYRITVRYIIDF